MRFIFKYDVDYFNSGAVEVFPQIYSTGTFINNLPSKGVTLRRLAVYS